MLLGLLGNVVQQKAKVSGWSQIHTETLLAQDVQDVGVCTGHSALCLTGIHWHYWSNPSTHLHLYFSWLHPLTPASLHHVPASVKPRLPPLSLPLQCGIKYLYLCWSTWRDGTSTKETFQLAVPVVMKQPFEPLPSLPFLAPPPPTSHLTPRWPSSHRCHNTPPASINLATPASVLVSLQYPQPVAANPHQYHHSAIF